MRNVTSGHYRSHRLARQLFWWGVIITIACTIALSAVGKNVLPVRALTPTPTATTCGTTNVARNTNNIVSASSNENATFPPSNAVDGNTGTRWASAFSDPQWFKIDFGVTRRICRVVLRWEAAYATAYQIQASSDNVNWTIVASTTTGDGGVDDWTGLNFTARYMRIYATQRATAYGYSLWEVEAYEVNSQTDLTISSVSTQMQGSNGGCVVQYGPFEVRVTVANIGGVGVGTFTVSMNSSSQTVSSLAAGQSVTLIFAVDGASTYTATADSTNAIVESNESNNTYSTFAITATPPPTCTKTPTPTMTPTGSAGNLPELSGQPSSMTVFGSPNGCTLGTSVLVRNTGTVASGAFVIRVSNSNTTGSIDTNVAGLAAGESRTIWVASTGGSGSTTTLVVDVTNVVVESNESNNTSSAMLPVPTLPPSCISTKTPTPTSTNTSTPTPTSTTGSGNLPDLVVLSMWAQQDPTANNGTCMLRQPSWGISVTVRNSGAAGAGSFVVDVAGIQKTVPAGLAVGETTSLWFPVSMSTARTATVDATFLVAELNENNNTYTISPVPGTATRTGTPITTCPPTPTTTPNPGNVPDLTGRPASITVFGSPNGCTLGTSVTVNNIGLVASGSFVIRVSYDGSAGFSEATVGPLAPGETRSVWTPARGSGSTVTLVVDVTNVIVELNEGNNTSSAMLPIPTLPPSCLTPTAVTQTATPTATRTATATATRTATVTNTTGPGCGTANIARGKPATASSSENTTLGPSLAVDGNTGTRWSSAHGVDPQWIRVDLGATTPICRVLLRWEAAYATSYQIQTSLDGATWTTIRALTGQNGGVDDNTGLSGSGRYLRIYGTARATAYGYSLFELEVY